MMTIAAGRGKIGSLHFEGRTQDDVPLVIGSIVGEIDGAYQCAVNGAASDAGGQNAAAFTLQTGFGFIVADGAVSVTSVPAQLAGNPITGVGAAYVIDLVTNGDSIDVRVTGFADTDVHWEVRVDLVASTPL